MTYQVPDWAGPFSESELFQDAMDYEANAPYDYMSEAYGNQIDAKYEAACEDAWNEENEVKFSAHVNAYSHNEWLKKMAAESPF